MPVWERTILRTVRLELGGLSAVDAGLINRYKNDVEIQLLSADTRSTETLQDTERRIERWMSADPNAIIHFGIRLRPARHSPAASLIGFCHIAEIDRQRHSCQLGIVIGNKELWGHGYAHEACSAIIDYCFLTLNMQRVGAQVYAHNHRSLKLFKNLGFSLETVAAASVQQAAGVVEYVLGLSRNRWVDRS